MVSIACPHCGSSVTVASEHMGAAARCPNPRCGQRFVPAAAMSATSPATMELPFAAVDDGSGVRTYGSGESSGNARAVAAAVSERSEMATTARPSADRPSSTTTKALGPEEAKSRKVSDSSAAGREAPKTRTVRAIGQPAPRQRPIGLVLGVGFCAMGFLGILAGLLRFQFPVPLVFSILAALAVGYTIAFAAGGRGSGVTQINLGMAFFLGAFAAFISWATLYHAVSWNLYNFSVKIIDTVESEPGSDGHLGGQSLRSSLKNGFNNQFAFATFVRLRSAPSDRLTDDVNNLAKGVLMSANNSERWWDNHRFVVKRCNGSFATFNSWTAEQFNNKFRSSVRIKGSALEGTGVMHSVLWAVEIVLAGALATLVYFRVCSSGAPKTEE